MRFYFGKSAAGAIFDAERCFSCSLHPVTDSEMLQQAAWEADGAVHNPQIGLAAELSL